MASVGSYVARKELSGTKRYPLVLMLEPLFRCNLACAGCGKIDYPDKILNERLPLADALHAMDECGAPVVVIAGGEPLLHKELPQMVEGAIAKKKWVTVCTNALLLEKHLPKYKPNKYFNWSIHLDGDTAMHDKSVCQKGVYDKALSALKKAKAMGFRVTINCTLFNDAKPDEVASFLDEAKTWGIEGITVVAGLRLRTRAGPAALPEPLEDQGAVPLDPRKGQRRQGVAVLPVHPVHGFPGGQPAVQLHPLGQPDAHGLRLAEALLSPRRRLCRRPSRS